MAAEYTQELQQKMVREKLNADKVKLWLSPYTKEDGSQGEIPQDFVTKYSKDLGLSEELVRETLEFLRQHALQKLSEREKFQKSGQATLKVKVTGKEKENTGRPKAFSLEVPLTKNGKDFRKQLSQCIGLPPDQLKMICQGRVIINEPALQDQHIKHGSQIMVLCLTVSQAEATKQQEQMSQMMNTRKAAELLSVRAENDDDEFDIQIADQTGRPLKLPAEEKRALTLATTLHEKGRVAMKRKEEARALLLLLEADKEFSKCSADILNAVDNYAVLCLDIVWCYLCLKNVEDLPDAETRLQKSEECFLRCYGTNMERLVAVKGGSGTELALFVRLHLLQGIVAFHQHRTADARRLLQKAEEEYQRLHVDEDKLTEVMSMGFSEREARLALRVTSGSIENAIQHVLKKREEKETITKKVKEDRRKRKLQKSLGKTASGDSVNVDNYEMLCSMGFPKGASAEALRQSNNNISQSLEVLQNHPELLDLPDPTPHKINITDDMLAQVVNMGFDANSARTALQKFSGSIQRAIEELIKSGGVITLSPDSSSSSSTSSAAATPEAGMPSLSDDAKKEEKAALKELVSDLPEDEDDYLDLTLQEEHQFLTQYKDLLESIPH